MRQTGPSPLLSTADLGPPPYFSTSEPSARSALSLRTAATAPPTLPACSIIPERGCLFPISFLLILLALAFRARLSRQPKQKGSSTPLHRTSNTFPASFMTGL